ALHRNQCVPSALTAIEDCVRGCARPGMSRAARQVGHQQFHWGNPPPAALPRRRTCTMRTMYGLVVRGSPDESARPSRNPSVERPWNPWNLVVPMGSLLRGPFKLESFGTTTHPRGLVLWRSQCATLAEPTAKTISVSNARRSHGSTTFSDSLSP